MNYDNYYKNGGMTKEESISAIALRIGARKGAVAKFVEEHDIDTNKLNSDLKSGKVFFMDVITGIVGKPNNKYQKEIIQKYGSKMAMGGKTQGYDDREDERLGMDYGKIAGKDFVGSHEMREHSRRDDARFEERMAMGGKTQGYDDREDERLGMDYGKIAGKDFVGSHEMREHSRRDDARFEERMEKGGKLYSTMMNVGKAKYVINFHDGKKTHKDGSPFYDVDIFSNRKDFDKAVKKLESEGYSYRYMDGGMMDDGGETGRDKNGMLYALQEHVSSGEIASKTNASKYEDIDKIRSKAIQYYLENGDKPYSYSELESVLKKFDHTNSIQSFYLHEYPTDDLGSEINPDATFYGLYEVLDNNGDVYEYLGVTDSLVRERVFEKLANFMGLDYDEIYSKWLSSDDNYAKGGVVSKYEKEKLKNLAYQLQNADEGWINNHMSEFIKMQNDYKKQFVKVYGHTNYEDPNNYAKGGGISSANYKISIYYGGEMNKKVVFSETLEEAKKLAQQGEHSEIIDINTNELIEYAKGGSMADGGGVEDSFLHLYKLTYPNGVYIVESYDGKYMSPKDAMEKMKINIKNFKSYKYKGVSSLSPKYKQWNDRKDIGYSDTEAWDEVFENEKYSNGGYMADGGVGEITPQLNKLVTKRAEEIYFKEKGKTKADFDKSFDKAIKEFGYEPNLYHKVMSEIGMEYEEYSNGGKMADGGIVKNIHEDLARINNRLKKLEEINSEDAYSESQMLRKQKSALEALLLNYEDEPRNTEFMYKARQHHYAEGGKLEAGVYRVGKPKRIDTNFYEQKIVEIFDNGDISTASDYARKSGDFLSQKYPIITAEQLKEQYKYAQGGELDLPKQNKYNKKVLELVNENGVDSKKEFGQLVVSAFTDANFHSEARKFVSILAKKPEWAKEPKLNYDLPLEELQKEKAKTVWGSEYYAPEDSVDNLGRKIANLGLWEFEPIVDSLIYASHMKGLHTIADALEKIKNSEEPENKWNYTDVDEIEYVVVKDKNGKELKFLGKYVLSGVHDLLEKGGKLSEMGKYYSKDNVVSVFVGGKNIIDKNTVSGVWIMKDAKPVAEDVVDMKIGKTTIKKGHNGWVGKTMVENFKGYDWDITTIKNYNGDLTTTAQGGKNEKKDGYGMFSFALYQDPNIRLKVSRPARVTDKVVTEQHEQAVKEFKERQDEIAEIVDKIQAKKKMADGGAIGFDALAKKVAKNYEGDKVKKEYQNQYGKTYDKKEAEEVGKKVAAKVYRQQQANQGKMKKGGKTSSYNRSESKMTKIARKASEIRKENEPWKDAFNRAKAMIG